MHYIGNTFAAVNMTDCVLPSTIQLVQLTLEQARGWVSCIRPLSCIGHAATAKLMSTLLGIDIPYRRTTVLFNDVDTFLVWQEGATTRWVLMLGAWQGVDWRELCR